MTLQECYAALGGNYEEALGRLMRDTLVRKFALRFLTDGSYDQLLACMSADEVNLEETFRAAHTLKGVCANLAFTELGSIATEMTELLRAGDTDGARALLPDLAVSHDKTVAALEELSKDN